MTDTGTDSYNATISISGLVTGQTYSVATTVNNKAGFSTTSSAAELKPRTPTGITISDAPVANVTDLATGTLNATITYNDGSTETTGVLWSSDNTPPPSSQSTPPVHGPADMGGVAVITAKVNDNNVLITDTATINVDATVANVSASAASKSPSFRAPPAP